MLLLYRLLTVFRKTHRVVPAAVVWSMWNRHHPRATPGLERLVVEGKTNLTHQGISQKTQKYVRDIYTTTLEIQWRWNLLIFVTGFVSSWFCFAAYYYVVDLGSINRNPAAVTPCIKNTKTFVAALLFSIETQTTIGYGSRYVTEECPYVYLIVMFQSLLGVLSEAVLAGIVIGKVKRGKKTSHTVFFSNSACVYKEDGELYLAVRVADIRRSQTVLEPRARGLLIRKEYSTNMGCLPMRYHSMKMRTQGGQKFLFTSWPSLVVHKIDKRSPCWNMSRDDFLQQNYEIILIVEGVVPSTSYPFRACASYLPWDICWGHRFVELDVKEGETATNVDFTNFHQVRPVKTPFCSAEDLFENAKHERMESSHWLSIPVLRHKSRAFTRKHHETDTCLGPSHITRSHTWL